ncbi:glycosyltransferase [Patescibacteria group bacterium]|nr:glycosyltransferase [Patescibacteria group bacterium]
MEKTLQNKAKIKVLFLITKSNFGGAQRYVYDLALNLDKSKFESVVALGGNGALLTMLQNANVHTITLREMQNSTSLKQAWRSYTELLQTLKSEKPDVLHLNSSIAGLVGAVAGRFARVPNIIFTAHGWAFNEDRPRWQRLIIKFFHYVTVLLSDRTIAVSNAIVSQMNWPGAQEKMKVINPGRTIGAMYDRNEARTKLIDFYPQLAAFVSSYWVTCVAELHPVKRHSVLIDAFAQRLQTEPNQSLVLIGEGKMFSELEKLIFERKLTDKIFLLGNVVDAARFLKAFDMFVLVSKSESYGYVLHEAGLAGVPIIATNVGGIPDIITHPHEGLLIPPDSTNNLVQALSETYKGKTLATERAQTLQTKLESRTVAKMTRQIESLYQIR